MACQSRKDRLCGKETYPLPGAMLGAFVRLPLPPQHCESAVQQGGQVQSVPGPLGKSIEGLQATLRRMSHKSSQKSLQRRCWGLITGYYHCRRRKCHAEQSVLVGFWLMRAGQIRMHSSQSCPNVRLQALMLHRILQPAP